MCLFYTDFCPSLFLFLTITTTAATVTATFSSTKELTLASIMSFILGPLLPQITHYQLDSPGLMSFQWLCANLVHMNNLLNIRLQALNEKHHPNHCLPGRCSCCGYFKLVIYLGVELPDESGFEALGRQKLQVCIPISLFLDCLLILLQCSACIVT